MTMVSTASSNNAISGSGMSGSCAASVSRVVISISLSFAMSGMYWTAREGRNRPFKNALGAGSRTAGRAYPTGYLAGARSSAVNATSGGKDVKTDDAVRAIYALVHTTKDEEARSLLQGILDAERRRVGYCESEILLIRVMLGLNPVHDVVECIRILFEQGREAFERVRGEPCEYAAEWRPPQSRELHGIGGA
jgi:hypothetical protein